MILITSIGEFLLYYCHFFYLYHFTITKKNSAAGLFLVLSCVALFLVAGIHFPVGLNTDQMEEGE